MYVFYLAGRYLMARPISWLAMAAIGLAVMALIVVVSVMNGFLDETRRFIRGTTTDLIIFPFQEKERHVVEREELERMVLSVPGIVGTCSRLVRPAIFKVHETDELKRERPFQNLTGYNSKDAVINQVLVLGMDPEAERTVTDLTRYLTDVETIDLRVDDPMHPFRVHRANIDRTLRNADLPRVLVGEPLMRTLGLEKGQALDLVTLPDGVSVDDAELRPTSGTFIISGAFLAGHSDFDLGHLLVERDDFRQWTNTPFEFSELMARVDEGHDLVAARDAVDTRLSTAGVLADVQTWRDRHRVWLGAVENERNILAFVLSLFVLLTCTITFSMLTMMVQEKVRDIGILAAMGAGAPGIGAVFGIAGVLIASVGGLFGLIAGYLLANNVNPVKDWIESTFGIQIFRKDVYAFTEIPVTLHAGLNVGIAFVTVFFAAIICIWPALRAARMDPVESLRHE